MVKNISSKDRAISDQDKKYPAPFSLRLSDAERTALSKLADGLPWGAYIKDVVFSDMRPARRGRSAIQDRKELAKLLGALGQSRISQNINQLAKAANSGSLPVNAEIIQSLEESVAAIKWMRETLIKGMGLKPHDDEQGENHDP